MKTERSPGHDPTALAALHKKASKFHFGKSRVSGGIKPQNLLKGRFGLSRGSWVLG
jgi:hypothetical protein